MDMDEKQLATKNLYKSLLELKLAEAKDKLIKDNITIDSNIARKS